MQQYPTLFNKTVTILLVDDDPGDQELTRRALRHESLDVDLRIVGDGEEAMRYLRRRDEYVDPELSPTPDLILLDLNMPKMNGREVLRELQKCERLARIPVVVLTTSQQETDIVRSYDLGCNSYIQKPVDMEQFIDSVRSLGAYWFRVVSLPPSRSAEPCSETSEPEFQT
ncbi:response regulator [Rhodopirellula sallentina]|uniref:Response regulator receiver protein n=1 Tax=Rhodopirellula sallentina SM41 TaxID=1263870 RepID=M5TSN6_9BACT|nr:response regulator [Rhodopirellula sallentina]EMI52170.1 response regulator receiver protein [Rhodopirellula sallentina SM41]